MCESRLILKKGDEEEVLMEEVAGIRLTPGGLLARDILGEEKLFPYEIVDISFIGHTISVKKESDL